MGRLKAVIVALSLLPSLAVAQAAYPWLGGRSAADTIEARVAPPSGYVRVPAAPGSYGEWLRRLPLKASRSPVLLFDGRPKGRQDVHHAVVDVDPGATDLQQCADAVMRLRAEYLYSRREFSRIAFDFTNGDRVPYARWREGERPKVVLGRFVRWSKAEKDPSYAGFRRYLDLIFRYAGSFSLSKELRAIPRPGDLEIGDVFIQGGFPGHAVLVVDAAADPKSGKKVFLLAQSYMPAQDVHVLKNLDEPRLSPWFLWDGGPLSTPEWDFPAGSLMRFP